MLPLSNRLDMSLMIASIRNHTDKSQLYSNFKLVKITLNFAFIRGLKRLDAFSLKIPVRRFRNQQIISEGYFYACDQMLIYLFVCVFLIFFLLLKKYCYFLIFLYNIFSYTFLYVYYQFLPMFHPDLLPFSISIRKQIGFKEITI